jgi:hypothetical protein
MYKYENNNQLNQYFSAEDNKDNTFQQKAFNLNCNLKQRVRKFIELIEAGPHNSITLMIGEGQVLNIIPPSPPPPLLLLLLPSLLQLNRQ